MTRKLTKEMEEWLRGRIAAEQFYRRIMETPHLKVKLEQLIERHVGKRRRRKKRARR